MQRVLIVLLALGWMPWPKAAATEQIPERFVVEGRVHQVPWVFPLGSKLTKEERKRLRLFGMSSALWRGYVGTWLIEGDALYLHSLVRYVYEKGEARKVPIPLTAVFPDATGPVLATWWSGDLVLQQGALLRDGYGWPALLRTQSLYLTIEEGRIAKRLVVDIRKEGRGRSKADILWVMKASSPVADDGGWTDARTIGKAAFRERARRGTPLRTRGRLSVASDGKASLHVPPTPATPNAYFELADCPEQWQPRDSFPVELVARYERKEQREVLRIVSWRKLLLGETIHHPDFEVPVLPLPALSKTKEGRPTPGALVWQEMDVAHMSGRYVSLVHKLVLLKGRATVLGVEVAADPALGGREVEAAGELQNWFITKALLERNQEIAQLFGDRGPGEYWRLVHAATGALAKPRATKSK